MIVSENSNSSNSSNLKVITFNPICYKGFEIRLRPSGRVRGGWCATYIQDADSCPTRWMAHRGVTMTCRGADAKGNALRDAYEEITAYHERMRRGGEYTPADTCWAFGAEVAI